jgi:hypothetical protein
MALVITSRSSVAAAKAERVPVLAAGDLAQVVCEYDPTGIRSETLGRGRGWRVV